MGMGSVSELQQTKSFYEKTGILSVYCGCYVTCTV